MKTYIVTEGPVSIGPGTKLVLTDEQIALRDHNLELAVGGDGEKGAMTPKVPIQFKTGEIFKMDGVPPKGVSEQLGDVAQMKPAEIAAVKTKARTGRSATAAKKPAKAAARG